MCTISRAQFSSFARTMKFTHTACVYIIIHHTHAWTFFFLRVRSDRHCHTRASSPSSQHHAYTYTIICICIYMFRSPKSRRRFILNPFRPRPEIPRPSYPICMYVHGHTYIYIYITYLSYPSYRITLILVDA